MSEISEIAAKAKDDWENLKGWVSEHDASFGKLLETAASDLPSVDAALSSAGISVPAELVSISASVIGDLVKGWSTVQAAAAAVTPAAAAPATSSDTPIGDAARAAAVPAPVAAAS